MSTKFQSDTNCFHPSVFCKFLHEYCMGLANKQVQHFCKFPNILQCLVHKYRDYTVPYARYFRRGYGIFYCDLMKHKVLLHWIMMKYAVSSMKMLHVWDCAISVIGTYSLQHTTLTVYATLTGADPRMVRISTGPLAQLFSKIFNIQNFIAIFDFSMKNALKWVQTYLVLVQWFLR